jgi:glycerate 2-kinase
MKVVVAPDKFKGSLSAAQAAEAIALGVTRADPDARIDRVPIADGGEGTVEALVAATGGTIRSATVTGPLGQPVVAQFGILGDGRTAVIEMAQASGLVLVARDQRNPWRTTTRGTGELLSAAVSAGANRIFFGIGGSATNDGGAGLAQALGYRLLDANGNEIGPGGGSLGELDRIDPGDAAGYLKDIEVLVACDVDNPLCGPRGASAVYGPQKGADREMIAVLDRNLDRLAQCMKRDLGISVRDLPGAGAAGGLGAGLVAFAGGRLQRGVELVIEAVGLAERLNHADLCLTGEGALDGSSAYGKTAVGVARLARSLGVPTIALAGTLGDGVEDVLECGIDAYFSLCRRPMALDQAEANASPLLSQVAEQAVRAFLVGRAHRVVGNRT